MAARKKPGFMAKLVESGHTSAVHADEDRLDVAESPPPASGGEPFFVGNHDAVRRGRVPKSVDPNRCKMWSLADRFSSRITVESCRSLIEDITDSGQSHRALARPVRGPDSELYDYELIYGARRRFSCAYLEIDLQIEVDPQLTDEEAFRLMRSENIGRDDLTVYESALSHTRALTAGIYANQTDLAKALEMSQSQVSKLTKIAMTPPEVVDAIGGPGQLTQRVALPLGEAFSQLRKRSQKEYEQLVSDVLAMQADESPRAIRQELFERLGVDIKQVKAQKRRTRSVSFARKDPKDCSIQIVGALGKPDRAGRIRAEHTIKIEGLDQEFCARTLDAIQDYIEKLDELERNDD